MRRQMVFRIPIRTKLNVLVKMDLFCSRISTSSTSSRISIGSVFQSVLCTQRYGLWLLLQ